MSQPRLSMADYRKADGISASDLSLIHRSPAHYREDLLNPREDTPATIFGCLFHTLALEPELFDQEYGLLPEGLDRRTKEGKEIWADWQLANMGKTPISKEDFDKAQAMVNSLQGHSRAKAALTDGHAERSIFWRTESSSHGPVLCKSRFDYVTSNGIVVDLKTCPDARIEPFSRDVWKYRYHAKAAFYLDAYEAEFQRNANGFLLIAIEKDPPYAVAVYLTDETMIDQGRREYQLDLNVFAECLATDTWPAYPDEVQAIILPAWARDDLNYG